MHRSGTSAFARSVSFCGYALPKDIMPAQPDNPKGFWEPLGIARLNDAVLADLGLSWDRPGPLLSPRLDLADSYQATTRLTVTKWVERAVAALQASFGDAPAIVLKDPRISLLLPLWMHALEDARYAARCFLVYRNPLEVAASLNKRNAVPPRRGMQLWLHYNLCCLRDLGTTELKAVSFHALLKDPGTVTTKAIGEGAAGDPSGEVQARIADFVKSGDNHFPKTEASLAEAPHVAGTIKKMWRLLENWNGTEPEARLRRVEKIGAAYDEAMLLAGQVVRPRVQIGALKATKITERARPPIPAPGLALLERRRGVRLVHYHLYKNAGTSVDEMLKQNFGGHWAEHEFSAPASRSNADEVAKLLRARPELVVLSSHTARLPLPELDGERIIPIVFLRHPIVRISSAYAFEKKRNVQAFSVQLAKKTDFAGYVRAHIDHPQHRGARNFQTYCLAFNEPTCPDSEFARALRAVRSLPFVGLVEAYEESVGRLERLVKSCFPHFTAIVARKNATRKIEISVEEELSSVRKQLGEELYAELLDCNRDDMELFAEVSRDYRAAAPAAVKA
jgi:hypothetical protein